MRYFTAAFAIAAGLIVLFGYFFPSQLEPFRLLLVNWAMMIAGIAVLVGIFNLVAVQMEKIRTRQKGGVYGVILIVSLFLTFVAGIVLGPAHPYMRLTMDAVVMPVEASLMAILAVTLIYASIRLLRRRVDVMSVLFLVVALVFLIAILPTPFGPLLGESGNQTVMNFLSMFSHGGTRALLIGIALGTLLTGLRVLFGIDRPYGDN